MPTLGKTKVSPSLISTGSSFLGTSSYAVTASFAMNGGGGGSGGNTQTGSIANQTILYNVTTSQDNVISGLNLSSNKWGVTVVEEWNSGSIVSDEYYNSSSLLMHFSGSNGSTTFIDNSSNNLTITSNNGASISTAQSKFGGASGLFDGTDDYLQVPYSIINNLGTGEKWTVELWINMPTLPATAMDVIGASNGGGAVPKWMLAVNMNTSFTYTANKVGFYTYVAGADRWINVNYTWSAGIWYNITAVYDSVNTTLYVNGVNVGSLAYNAGSSTNGIRIGSDGEGYKYFNGYIDELRVTKGIARYTGSFVTQSIEFPNSIGVTQYATKYIGLVGGLNDSTVDYGVEKLSDSSLKIRKMTASGQPLSGSGTLSASVDRVYVNVLDYTNVMVTSSYALTASYVLGGIQTGSISNQTILYNVTTSQDNTITGLDLSGNKWDVSVIEEWNSASIVGDEYYNSCSLLMHFSGSNGSTTFVDNSPITKTFTRNGNAQISTTQYKFISSSLYLDGTGDYLSSPSNADYAFGTGDFTIECWAYRSVGNDNGILQISSTVGGLQANNTTNLAIASWNSGRLFIHANNTEYISTAFTNTVNTWNHYALVRNSGVTKLYFNGNLVTDIGTSGAITDTINYTGTYLVIGGYYSTTYLWNGYIDELRITKGVARYTGNFVTQSVEFLDNLNVTQLQTKYIGLVGGINDSAVDYGVEKLSDTSLKIRKMTASGQPLSGSGALSASVDRVYVNVLNYKEVQTTAQSASYAVSSSYSETSLTSSFALSASYLIPTSNNTTKAIFGYGYNGSSAVSMTNLVSNTGVVATDTTGVGTARRLLAAAGYGTDKAIFGYGLTSVNVSMTNLVSNTGVVANDVTGVGTARYYLAAARYGGDKAIFGYGYTSVDVSMINLVSNTGVVANDTTGVGTAREALTAAGYGSDKAIFGYGEPGATVGSMTNLVSNTGVVANDVTGVGTARYGLAAAGYGTDKAIFGYGFNGSSNVSMTNLVSNTGVVATDTTGVGTARQQIAAASYGTDKAIFGYGFTGAAVSMTNLVSNTGVVATDTTGIGTARWGLAAAGYSTT